MANEHTTTNADAYRPVQPIVNTIGVSDLKDALAKGFADFNALPTHLFFLCLVYPIVMVIAARVAAGYEVLPLVFPILAGYTLIGPLVAVGMYELSRRREQGIAVSRRHAFQVIRSPSITAIVILALILMAIYFTWLAIARAIYESYFAGFVPDSIGSFFNQIFNTSAGPELIVVGCGIGFLFAVAVLALSVVSFPMLIDRNVGVMTAIGTSVRVVVANPVTMAIWGLIVSAALTIGALPFFVGLAVVLPVLGHASWHLYRKAVKI